MEPIYQKKEGLDMITIKHFIRKRDLTLLAGAEGIGKAVFYSNLLLDGYETKKVLILKNTGGKEETIEKLNKILYADSGRKNRFLNYEIYDHVFDVLDVKELITKHNKSDLVVIDRLDLIAGDMEENINEIRKLSIDYRIPILVLKNVLVPDDDFRELYIDDLGMEKQLLNMFSGFILLNRESYYNKRGSSNLVVAKRSVIN